jgi:riboflavin synthase
MFTGLVQAMGMVSELRERPGGVRLVINPGDWLHGPELGESIAVNGVCLTLATPLESGERGLAFDVVRETLTKTALGGLREASAVNLEASVTPATLLGGHIVQGHVDGVGVLERVQKGEDWRIRVRPPTELMPYIVPQGSVAVDGVSLTVAAVDPGAGWFEVALIPTTLSKTTLGRAATGDRCNLEADALAKTVVHYLRHYAGGRGG